MFNKRRLRSFQFCIAILITATIFNAEAFSHQEIPDISGAWRSSDGRTVEISQVGRMFEWVDHGIGRTGMGVIEGDKLEISWKDDYGTHSSTWKIGSFDSKGRPTSIIWQNGKAFVRAGGEQLQTQPGEEKRQRGRDKAKPEGPKRQPPAEAGDKAPEKEQPSEKSIHDISGAWSSNISVVYQVTQTGDKFEWLDTNINVKGQGTIDGNGLTATFTDATGTHTAKGIITEFDPTGKPMRAVWDIGIVWQRQSVTKQPQPGQQVYDISGEWNSNIGVKFVVKQAGSKFEWLDTNSGLIGYGDITGTSVGTSWVDPNGTHSATGNIELDKAGKPLKVTWSNGIVFIGPPAAKKTDASLDLSGEWVLDKKMKFTVGYDGILFVWIDGNDSFGTMSIAGKDVTFTHHTNTLQGRVAEYNSEGQPSKIVLDGNLTLFRMSSAKQAQTHEVRNITGIWKSDSKEIAVIQTGNKFIWSNNDETYSGKIEEDDLTFYMSSTVLNGEIKEYDSMGRPSKIKMDSGIQFIRASTSKKK